MPEQIIGQPCSSDSQCLSEFCIDGFCCDTACTGQCEACDVQGSLGTCTTVTGAPHGGRAACVGFGPCAANCTGASSASCSSPDTTTVCGVGACSAGIVTNPPTCNGGGSCLEPTVASCAPYLRCDGDGGASSCRDSTECSSGFECIDNECQRPIPDGGAGMGGSAGGPVATGGGAGMPGSGGTGGSNASGGSGGSGAGTSTGGSSMMDAGVDGGGDGDPGESGGCGCRTAGSKSSSLWLPFSLALLALGRRRRRLAA